MDMKHSFLVLGGLLLCVFIYSCQKDFLEKKPLQYLTVPTLLEDYQGMLDNNEVIQEQPGLGQAATDDYYKSYDSWLSSYFWIRNSYVWAPDIFEGQGNAVPDWTYPYQQAFLANVILEGLEKITPVSSEQEKWKSIKGSAYFIRAYAFYNLAELFSKPFDPVSASSDLGIPLRLSSDLNVVSTRATVQQTFTQILSDLTAATKLLPIHTAYRNRPSKPAAFALIARVYATMGNYALAGSYADSCLQLQGTLLDYNQLNITSTRPFVGIENPEIVYYSCLYSNYLFEIAQAGNPVDSTIYSSYAEGDLRKKAFFRISPLGEPYFKGYYSIGQIKLFSGPAVDEMYLLRAECYARAGKSNEAMGDLNTLLEKRWIQGAFIPLQASSATEALHLILKERRKELVFRGLRWNDLRRLNTEPSLAITLSRVLNGKTYTLPPNDSRYAFPIPDDEILLSGIEQNKR
jgi:starch-binding outer membrane protein, SusD/RagB family